MAEEKITRPRPRHFKVSGAAYRQKDILSIMEKNADYQYTNSDFIDYEEEDEKVYQYVLPEETAAEIKSDPEGTEYAGALGVYIRGVKVGYIFKEDREKIAPLLQEDPHIFATAEGGKYKVVETEDYETKDGDIDFKSKVEQGDDGDIEIRLTVYTGEQWARELKYREEIKRQYFAPDQKQSAASSQQKPASAAADSQQKKEPASKPVKPKEKKPHGPKFFYVWAAVCLILGILLILLPVVGVPLIVLGVVLIVIGKKRKTLSESDTKSDTQG